MFAEDVQLGDFDVPAATMNEAGRPLEDLVGTTAAVLVDDMHGPPPDDGWRLIAGDLASPSEKQPVLAAPWDNPRGNGWMVIQLSRRDGIWYATTAGDRGPIRRSRRLWRDGLQLTWSAEAAEQAAHLRPTRGLDPLTVILTNTSARRWTNEGGDHDFVPISVCDKDGTPVTTRGVTFAAALTGIGLLPPMEPGEQMTLLASIYSEIAPHMPIGPVTLVATLNSLRLSTSPLAGAVDALPTP
jgi:hypothetical protein